MTQQLSDLDKHLQDDLIALVAGTLDGPDFERVCSAVAKDAALRRQLQNLEMIHAGMLRDLQPAEDASLVAATTAQVLRHIADSSQTSLKTAPVPTRQRDLAAWIRTTWVWICQPERARWAYGAVVVQAAMIVFLAINTIPWQAVETSAMRGGVGGANSKHVGVTQGNVLYAVTFSESTPESSMRALLLEIQAEIVSGPNQLGQYKISVARNRSELAQHKLKESNFVHQVFELAQ